MSVFLVGLQSEAVIICIIQIRDSPPLVTGPKISILGPDIDPGTGISHAISYLILHLGPGYRGNAKVILLVTYAQGDSMSPSLLTTLPLGGLCMCIQICKLKTGYSVLTMAFFLFLFLFIIYFVYRVLLEYMLSCQ